MLLWHGPKYHPEFLFDTPLSNWHLWRAAEGVHSPVGSGMPTDVYFAEVIEDQFIIWKRPKHRIHLAAISWSHNLEALLLSSTPAWQESSKRQAATRTLRKFTEVSTVFMAFSMRSYRYQRRESQVHRSAKHTPAAALAIRRYKSIQNRSRSGGQGHGSPVRSL